MSKPLDPEIDRGIDRVVSKLDATFAEYRRRSDRCRRLARLLEKSRIEARTARAFYAVADHEYTAFIDSLPEED